VTTPLNQQRIDWIDEHEAYEIPDAPSISVEPGQDVGDLIDTTPAGTTLILEDGDHEIGRITRSAGCTVMARNCRMATVKANSGDTISCMDGALLEETLFRGLFIEASGRSAVMTLSEKPPYRFNFLDCVIDGGYDHATGQGFDSKWGLMIHRWAGWAARCTFRNIKREHGAYIHTPMSDILLYKNVSENLGRTSYQFVGRRTEAGYADIELHVKDCTLKNPGLRDGGSSLTVQGIGTLLVEDSEFLIGQDRQFRDAYMNSHPNQSVFSTGHIVNWDDLGRCDPTKQVTFKNVNVWSHPGDGQAPCVTVKNADALKIEGRAYVQTGFNSHAFELKQGMPVDISEIGDYKLGGQVVIG
jgi:hypothetical protein